MEIVFTGLNFSVEDRRFPLWWLVCRKFLWLEVVALDFFSLKLLNVVNFS